MSRATDLAQDLERRARAAVSLADGQRLAHEAQRLRNDRRTRAEPGPALLRN